MGLGCGEYAHIGCILRQRVSDPDGEDESSWDVRFLLKQHSKYFNFGDFVKEF